VCAANEVLARAIGLPATRTATSKSCFMPMYRQLENEPGLNALVSSPYDELLHSVRQGDMSDLSEGD
jgi:hypothetical protein